MIPQVYRDKRFIGMKPYLQFGVEYHHHSYDIWWQLGNRHNLYALIHRGAYFRQADMATKSILKHPNVHAEITLTPVTFGIIDYLVKHAGEERVVYGSDLPMRDPRQQLGWVVFPRLSPGQKVKVLGVNALRTIQPCAARLPLHSQPPELFQKTNHR